MTIREQIAVMQAYESGKQIEYSTDDGGWFPVDKPFWNWAEVEYRVKPNKIKEVVDYIDSHDITTTHITFGGVENYNTKSLKVVYDTHIRTVLFDMLDVGKTVKFKLVPLNHFGESVLEEINISRYAK